MFLRMGEMLSWLKSLINRYCCIQLVAYFIVALYVTCKLCWCSYQLFYPKTQSPFCQKPLPFRVSVICFSLELSSKKLHTPIYKNFWITWDNKSENFWWWPAILIFADFAVENLIDREEPYIWLFILLRDHLFNMLKYRSTVRNTSTITVVVARCSQARSMYYSLLQDTSYYDSTT